MNQFTDNAYDCNHRCFSQAHQVLPRDQSEWSVWPATCWPFTGHHPSTILDLPLSDTSLRNVKLTAATGCRQAPAHQMSPLTVSLISQRTPCTTSGLFPSILEISNESRPWLSKNYIFTHFHRILAENAYGCSDPLEFEKPVIPKRIYGKTGSSELSHDLYFFQISFIGNVFFFSWQSQPKWLMQNPC